MLSQIIDLLIFASLGITIVRYYLTLNKIWPRKHDRNVAESVSVLASLLGIATTLPFFRMIARSQSRSTSLKVWLEKKIVDTKARDHLSPARLRPDPP